MGQKQRSGRNREQPVVHKPELNRKACYANTAHPLPTLSQQQTKWLWGFLSSWQHAGSEGSSGHRMGMHFLPSLGGRGQSPWLGRVAYSSRRLGAPKDDAAEQYVLCEGFFISLSTSLLSLTAFKCRSVYYFLLSETMKAKYQLVQSSNRVFSSFHLEADPGPEAQQEKTGVLP